MIKQNFIIFFFTILLFLVSLFPLQKLGVGSDLDGIVQTTIQSISGLMGFLLAAAALVFSFGENRKIERLKRSNQYPNLIGKYSSSIGWFGLVTISGIIIEIIGNDSFDFYWLLFTASLTTIILFDLMFITHKIMMLSKES